MRGELDWIVMKCLEKDRTRRYETANGLARDVERLPGRRAGGGLPAVGLVSAPQVRPTQPSCTGDGFGRLARPDRWNNDQRPASDSGDEGGKADGRALDMAKEQQRLADEHRSQAERHLYATRLRFAQQSLESGQLDRAREILAALESQPDSFMGGEFAWRYVRARAWDVLRPVGPAGQAGMLAVSSKDGRFLASFNYEGPIHLIDGANVATPGDSAHARPDRAASLLY